MADPKEYLLTFDFSEFEDAATRASRTYTQFGEAVKDTINSISGDLSELQQTATTATSTIVGLSPTIDRSISSTQVQLGATVRGLGELSQHSEKIANNMTRLTGMDLGSLVGKTDVGKTKAQQKAEGAVVKAAVGEEMASGISQQAKAITKEAKKSAGIMSKTAGAVMGMVKSEFSSLKSTVKGTISSATGGVVGGGILATLMKAMIFGYKERTRLDMQGGQLKNVLEASGEALYGATSQKAQKWFGEFQEQAQWFYGISLQETQSVLKTMVDAGYKSTDLMTVFNADLGRVGENIGVATIALDKHSNLATGTTMKNAVQITLDYGDSLEVASHKYTKIAFAAQRSGMGTEKFVNAVMSGASAMKQYAVDVEDVADVMGKIQRHYKDMGLSEQYAGGQAAKVVQGMGSGLANLSPGMKKIVAERMFPEYAGLDAVQRFEDSFVKRDKEFMRRTYVVINEWSREGGRSRAQAIKVMEGQSLDNRTATTVYDMNDTLKKKNWISEATKEQLEAFEDSFKTESERISSLQKTQRQIFNGLSQIGKGLLQILTGIFGTLAVGIRGLSQTIGLALGGDLQGAGQKIMEVQARQDLLFSHMGVGVSNIMKGIGTMGGALGKEFRGTFSVLRDVFPEDKKGKGAAVEEKKSSNVDELRNQLNSAKQRIEELLGAATGGAASINPLTSGVQRGADDSAAAQGQLQQQASSGAKTAPAINVNPVPAPTEAMGGPVAMAPTRGSTRVTVSADQIASLRMRHEEGLVIG